MYLSIFIRNALNVCRKKKNLEYAKVVYKHIQNCQYYIEKSLGSYLVSMFVECGGIYDAYSVFKTLTY